MVKAICRDCVKDSYLKDIFKKEGKTLTCSICGEVKNYSISVRKLSKIIEPIMSRYFSPGMFIQNTVEGHDEYFQEGSPMSSVVQQVLNQFISIADDIVDSIIEFENFEMYGDSKLYWDKDSSYIESNIGADHYLSKWQGALNELKHSRRFFSPEAKHLFEELFEGVENLRGWDGKVFKPVVRRLPTGSKLFRARICKNTSMLNEIIQAPFMHVGPPPAERARAGRMNPEGVPVLYGSREIETCLAEMRPALGNDVAVIALQVTKPMRVLDFSRLEQARSGGAISYFQPDFKEQHSKQAFLKLIHKLISQHVVPGREPEYIITQTMAEYLAHVYQKPFDGILFSSTQHEKGTNIVLFAKDGWYASSEQFSVSYLSGSLKVFTTRGIKYEHTESDSVIQIKADREERGEFDNFDDGIPF